MIVEPESEFPSLSEEKGSGWRRRFRIPEPIAAEVARAHHRA